MCGIAGAFRIGDAPGPPLDHATLRRMTDAMHHRGPDDDGLVLVDGASLGARRLSIVDLRDGHQPMSNERGTVWAAQNGELYNHEQVRGELASRGHVLRNRCDTEILPHLYEEHGPGMVARLRGKYAVAAWDSERRAGVLGRDRLGIKPLYVAEVGDLVLFASELKSIVASGLIDVAIDREAIAAYFALGFIPAPLSPLKGVRKLLPGELMIVDRAGARRETYWEYPSQAPSANVDEREAAEWLLEVLDESVRLRLMSDVPLGAMLSGGLDSSLIVALMARHLDRPVDTFSVGFSGPGQENELADARRVAEALQTSHHELELPVERASDDLATLAWHMDEPMADLSALGFHALCGLAREHVTVALSGQGADELVGGYKRHIVASMAGTWERTPGPLRALAAAAARRGPARARRIVGLMDAPDPAARLLASTALMRRSDQDRLFGGALAEYADAAARQIGARAGSVSALPALEAALSLEAQLGMADDRLHYFDRTSMAWSLEVRVPFLDHHVVEACAQMPSRLKVRGTKGKRVLHTAARGIVPDFVLSKRKLGFFSESVDGWLATQGGAAVDRLLLDGEPACAELLDGGAVRDVVRGWRGGDAAMARPVLGLLMLELWMTEFLPRAEDLARGATPEGAVAA